MFLRLLKEITKLYKKFPRLYNKFKNSLYNYEIHDIILEIPFEVKLLSPIDRSY